LRLWLIAEADRRTGHSQLRIALLLREWDIAELHVHGVLASLIGFGAMFRNATPAAAPVPNINNAVLPLWLVILGIALARERARE
jgi:hypothetical protein